MPQEPVQKIRNQFNKGLLTEFSELNFPENASIDELNCDLLKAGNRTRRLGIAYETGNAESASTYTASRYYGTPGIWRRVGRDEALQYVIVQAGQWLIFYKKTDNALSSEEVPVSDADSTVYRIDLNDYIVSGTSVDITNTPVDAASINGFLVVVGEGIKPFYVERDNSDGTFTIQEIEFTIRDFEYLGDKSTYFAEITTPSDERLYDTYNTGWDANQPTSLNALNAYIARDGNYPPLSAPWYIGKGSGGLFDYDAYVREWKGTTLAVNGHFFLNPFTKDRATASGIAGLPIESTSKRFKTVVAYSSRLFYAGIDSRIYFTQVFEGDNEFGNLYQRNDPTAETFNSLLDTDGGSINIPEAVNIKKIHVFGASIMVFADNGVWRISGVDGVFRATEFSVYKVSDEGLMSANSFVAGRNAVPFWWSFNGIHTVQVTDEGGMVEVNLSRDTIQTFWNDIGSASKEQVKASYDRLNSRVLWMYPNNGENVTGKINNILLLDTELGAFFPWKISDAAENSPYILDGLFLEGPVSLVSTLEVIDSLGNQVEDSLSNTVVQDREAAGLSSLEIKFLTYNPSTSRLTFSAFNSTGFLDWGTANYVSYAEAAYNALGDLGRRKSNPYLTVLCRTTESAWVLDGGSVVFDRPSSLLVTNYWDFDNNPVTTQQQAYRLKRPVVSTGSLAYSPEQTVVTSRLKMRGRGRILRFKFESEEGKDFNLLGWEVLGGINPTY